MFRILKQPYPIINDPRHHLKVALYISIFVVLFLLLFKPFGLANYEGSNWRITGYGAVTFFTLWLVYFVNRKVKPDQEEEKWTTGKEILSQLLYIFVLGIANVCYTHYVFGLYFSIRAFLDFQVFTLLIGIFPVSFFVLVNHVKLLHRNEKEAARISEEIAKHQDEEKGTGRGQIIRLTSENEKEVLDIAVDDLVLIESADNYSTVYFLSEGKIQNRILRSSLKRLEQQARHENLLRCHRTYLVNLQKVVAVKGNAQGYRLRFNGFDQTFPVSRSFNGIIRERLQQIRPAEGRATGSSRR